MQLSNISKLMGSSALIFACRLSGAVIVFATQILLARWMGAQGLGIYVLAFSWCLLISTVTGLGYPAAGLRFIGENIGTGNPGQIRGFIEHSRKVVMLSSGTAGALASVVIYMFRDQLPDNYAVPLIIAMLSVPIMTAQRLHDKIAHAFSWFTLAFLPSMTGRPLLFLALVAGVFYGGITLTAENAMLLQLAAIFATFSIQYLFLRAGTRRELGDAKAEYGKSLWNKTAVPLLITTLFVQYFPELSVTLIGLLLPAADVAVYYTCFRIALLIAFALTAVNALLTPRISALYAAGKLDELQHAVRRTTQIKFCCALLALALIVVFGKQILLLFGDEFVAGYPVVLALAASQLILAATGPVDVLLNLTGHQNVCMRTFAAALVLAAILILAVTPLFGILGAAFAVTATTAFWNIWLHQVVVAELGIHPSILSRRKKSLGG